VKADPTAGGSTADGVAAPRQLGEAAGSSAATDRRVLVVTYYFPPVGGIGVVRTLKYALYLPRWGWQPVIVAPGDPEYPVRDSSLLEALPSDMEVHRTRSLEPGKLLNAVVRRLGRSRPGGEGVSDLASQVSGRGLRTRVLRRLLGVWRWFWGIILFPDWAVPWLPFAVRAATRAHRRTPVDGIYSSGPPFTCHLAAGMVKGRIHRPWVADFRDPWIGNAFEPKTSRPKRWLQRRAERWIVTRADRVTLAVEALREMYAERYPEFRAKFTYIPNGYDPADQVGVEPLPSPRPGGFHLLYAGSLYRPKELEVFLTGAERLLERRPDLRSRLRIDFVGRVKDANARIIGDFSTPGRLSGIVSMEGLLPRRMAIGRMMGADALLQLMPDVPGSGIFVGGKLAEYLGFDRPILAVMPPGEGRTLVESLPTGIVADVEPESVAAALERLLDHPPAPAPADPEGRFSRPNLAGELAAVLDALASAND